MRYIINKIFMTTVLFKEKLSIDTSKSISIEDFLEYLLKNWSGTELKELNSSDYTTDLCNEAKNCRNASRSEFINI